MIKRIKLGWQKATLNEKLMYGLIVVLLIGIITRGEYVLGEIGDAFSHLIGTPPSDSVSSLKIPPLK